MKREVPITIRQLQLFREAESVRAAKVQAIETETTKTVHFLAAGIVAGCEQIGGTGFSLSEWRGDPPRLIIETDEPDAPAGESASDAFVREALKADATPAAPAQEG